MKQEIILTEEFKNTLMKMCIDSWYDMFNGIDYVKPFDEIIYLYSNIEEIERYISAYENKFHTKLKYRLDNGCSYISQIN